MMSTHTYKSSDYYLLFQTEGLNLLFTDLCIRNYNKFDGIALSRGNQYQYYTKIDSTQLQKLCSEYYESTESVEKFSGSLQSAIERVLAVQNPTAGDFEQFVSDAGIILDEYAKFDHLFTDFLFTDTREDKESFITFVQEKKNVFREEINKIFFNEDSVMLQLIEHIAQETSIPVAKLLYCTVQEVREALEGTTPAFDGANGDDFVLVRDGGQIMYYKDTSASEFITDFIVEENVSEVTTIEGTSVSQKGTYTGVVRNVSVDYGDLKGSIALLDAIEDDVILVTESTVPEMIPVMSRAQAIVTDMGGMLSHAAITSRELKKPCIIGTKIATQVLKDGDKVEVDADNGIVKILS